MWGITYFRGSATPLPQGAVPRRSPFFDFPSIYAYTVWRRTTKFDVATHVGRELVLKGQPRPNPSAPHFMASFLLMRTPCPLSQNYQIWRDNTCGEGRVSWGQPCPRDPSFRDPNFGGSLVFLCLYSLTQNDQIRHGNTYREGRILGGSHAITFAQIRRAVYQRLPSFL